MPQIDFSFSGWVRGADVRKAVVATTGKSLDVSQLSAVVLCRRLRSGELLLALGDFLYQNTDSEIDIRDFDPKIGRAHV